MGSPSGQHRRRQRLLGPPAPTLALARNPLLPPPLPVRHLSFRRRPIKGLPPTHPIVDQFLLLHTKQQSFSDTFTLPAHDAITTVVLNDADLF